MKLLNALVVASTLGSGFLSNLAMAQCDDESQAAATVESLDRDADRMHDERKAKEALVQKKIDAVASSLMQRGKWTETDRSAFFVQILKSDDFRAFDEKKLVFFNFLTRTVDAMSTQKAQGKMKDACLSAESLKVQLAKVGELNDMQYDYMLMKIRCIAAAP